MRKLGDDRRVLAALAREAKGGVIAVDAAARAMRLPPAKATVRLARLAKRGWLERLRRGLYLIRPIGAAPDQGAIPEDAWVLAQEVLSPCYVGGWSAAEHWELTEQLFRSTLVITAAASRTTDVTIGGHNFRIFRIPESRLDAGIVRVWRGPERVSVSGLERTVIDGLRNPELLGGGRHLVQIVRAYGEHERHDFVRLLELARREATGAAWKRLGFLAERLWPGEPKLADTARRHLSSGLARLDPRIAHRGKLSKRWRLWINVRPAELATSPDAA